MKLFDYAVIKTEKRDKDGEISDPASILVEPTTILASDEAQAQLLAARAIPEEAINGSLDRILVVVRPF